MSKETVLFIAYEFPPEGCRGTKRGLKFLKYLPGMGWRPIVLTVKSPNYDFHDGTLIAELPEGIPVYRAFTAESLFHKKRYSPGAVRDAMADKRNTAGQGRMRRLLLRVYHAFGNLLEFADSRFLWLPFAVFKGLGIIARNRVGVIFASGPSFTNHIVGAILKKLTGVPLVVDFRDAWISDPAKNPVTTWHRKVLEAEERFVISTANRVVSTTDGIRDDFVSRYHGNLTKFVTVTNGFDRSDFQFVNEAQGEGKPSRSMRIVHAGTLGWERTPIHFLKAVRRLKDADPAAFRNIEVVFVGQNSRFRDGKTIEEYVDEMGIKDRVILTGFVSRKESLRYMMTADLLLLIIGDVPENMRRIYGISAKIYDYALTGKPTITISGEGASADMARYLRAGDVIHPNDEAAITASIKRLYSEFTSRGGIACTIHQGRLDEFDFTNLSKKLSQCFRDITLRRRTDSAPVMRGAVQTVSGRRQA